MNMYATKQEYIERRTNFKEAWGFGQREEPAMPRRMEH